MRATGLSGDTRRHARYPHRLLLSISCFLAMSLQTVGAAEKDMAAVLKLHELSFTYRPNASVLSCGHIKGRVISILRALGARQDITVDVNGCNAVMADFEDPDPWDDRSDPWGARDDPFAGSADPWDVSGSPTDRFGNRRRAEPRQSSHVRIRAMLPVEATPEVLAEIEKDKARRELLARVTGNPLNEPIIFSAERRVVELSRKTLKLRPEECELLEQMSRGVFRKIGARIVKRPSCRGSESIAPYATVEALLPVLPTVPQLSTQEQEDEHEKEDAN